MSASGDSLKSTDAAQPLPITTDEGNIKFRVITPTDPVPTETAAVAAKKWSGWKPHLYIAAVSMMVQFAWRWWNFGFENRFDVQRCNC